MKSIITVMFFLFCAVLPPFTLFGGSGGEQLRQIAKEVAALQLGFGDYILGASLNESQKKIAGKNGIARTLPGTYKFIDGDIFVIAKADDNTVLGIYKDNPVATRDDVKTMVGDLMMRFDEPTTMAHDKVIYWAFGKNGKVSKEMYNFSKKTGESEIIATVKLQSSVPIHPDSEKDAAPGEKQAVTTKSDGEEDKAGMYTIITSSPMSKLFLALNKHE